MYQFERSSTNDSNGAINAGVQERSYASCLGDELLRARDEPAVERAARRGPPRLVGLQPSMFA